MTPPTAKVVAVFGLSILGLSVGNALLKLGMDRLGAPGAGVRGLLPLALGMALMVGQFVGMLTLFKWGYGVSVVVPIFGLNYVVTALLGQFWLGESLSPQRWFGILVTMAGVALLTATVQSKG